METKGLRPLAAQWMDERFHDLRIIFRRFEPKKATNIISGH
jgi:hypothetical protein